MKNKVLVVIVTRNNAVLLQNLLESTEKYEAGYDHDILVIDNSSDNIDHKKVLNKWSSKLNVLIYQNNRVEVCFDLAWRQHQDYQHYFFMHDDSCINSANWLKSFVDKMNSGEI